MPTSTTNISLKQYSGIAARALELLGNGLAADVVASALGVSPSYISQLLSDEDFASQVLGRRFEAQAAAKALDDKYDRIENSLLDALEEKLLYLHKPSEILRAVQIINAAKRRGTYTHDANSLPTNQVVSLTMPVKIVNNFLTDMSRQVVGVSSSTVPNQTKSLVTIQSNNLDTLVQQTKQLDRQLERQEDETESPAGAS